MSPCDARAAAPPRPVARDTPDPAGLGAALATPPALWAVKGVLRFGFMTVFGYDVVEGASWYDKSLMMMLAMVNGGIVTLLCWEALLVDRRDALVLGSLPVSSHAIVGAKAVALFSLGSPASFRWRGRHRDVGAGA